MDDIINTITKDLALGKFRIVEKDELGTPTMLGAVIEDVIYLKRGISDMDCAFTIAHELRHAWQKGRGEYFENYKSVGEIGLEAYNNQKEEIDANAYALIVMVDLFGVKPLFRGVNKATKKKIEKRAREIAKGL